MSECYIGEIRLLPYRRGAPSGWQICDGSLLSISEYDALYQLLGTTYGGDGQSNFAVPDLRGRVPVHNGTGGGLSPRPPGMTAGTETVTLTMPQMGAHSHTALASTVAATSNSPQDTVMATASAPFYNIVPGNADVTSFPAMAVRPSGGDAPHDNTAPTLAMQYCIAWTGVWPTRA